MGLGGTRARVVAPRERGAVLAYLDQQARDNLLLIEMVESIGGAARPHEPPPKVVAAWRGRKIVGVVSTRPSIVIDYDITPEGLDACLPSLVAVESGLVKSAKFVVDPLWERLRLRGRHALIDRIETTYAMARSPEALARVAGHDLAGLRAATAADHEDLVYAARASLREEDRPDPFDGDPAGFRRWVAGRVERARIVEVDGEVVFVGYADVRRPDGWLIQGVYTWPRARQQGHATTGMMGIIAEAFANGADHVQLAVVEGNVPALALYARLGFEPHRELRTILFI